MVSVVVQGGWLLLSVNDDAYSPGRFFVAHEIKLILAHLFTNYDLQHIEKRPQPFWLGAICVPALAATIKIRKKAEYDPSALGT